MNTYTQEATQMAQPPHRLTTSEQPRHLGIVFRGRDILPPDPEDPNNKKAYRDQTWTEKWWGRRHRWFRVLPSRVRPFETAFNNLLKLAEKERYEITEEERASLIAHLQAWVDAVDQSFKAGKVLHPSVPPIVLDCDLDPPEDAIKPPDELRDIW